MTLVSGMQIPNVGFGICTRQGYHKRKTGYGSTPESSAAWKNLSVQHDIAYLAGLFVPKPSLSQML
jgi:hypothetical protein